MGRYYLLHINVAMVDKVVRGGEGGGHWWREINVIKYIITRKKVLKIISVIFIMWQWAWLIKAEGAALVDRTDILHKISSHK